MDSGDKVALIVGAMSFIGAGFQSILVFVIALLNRKRDKRIDALEEGKKDKDDCKECGRPKLKI